MSCHNSTLKIVGNEVAVPTPDSEGPSVHSEINHDCTKLYEEQANIISTTHLSVQSQVDTLYVNNSAGVGGALFIENSVASFEGHAQSFFSIILGIMVQEHGGL